MINFYFILFCIIYVRQLTIASDAFEGEKQVVPCGLYGFRCLNEKRAQICDDILEDDGSSYRPRIFVCAEGLVCDENKKEFCSPVEPSHHNSNCSKANIRKKKSKSKKYYKRDWSDFLEDANDTTTTISKTTVDDDEDDEKPNTEGPKVDAWNGNPPITCAMYGFYPDNTNKSLFLFCDLKKNGKDFILRQMRCGPNRVFDANFRACIVKGTTRSARRNEDFNYTEEIPGKYPDSPFQLLAEYSRSTAFHSYKQKGSRKACKTCQKAYDSNVFCEKEIRFRETRFCDRYFLCYRELVVEFLCPPGFRFDESLQFCELKRLVTCE